MTTAVIKDLGLIRAGRCGTCYHNIFDMNMQKKDYEEEKKSSTTSHTCTHNHTGYRNDKKREKGDVKKRIMMPNVIPWVKKYTVIDF